MPQGLGMFEQNWTLPDACDPCNQTFGRELDLHLMRLIVGIVMMCVRE